MWKSLLLLLSLVFITPAWAGLNVVGNLTVPTGNVGIGSTAPGQALDVQGTARLVGLRVTTSPTMGWVLTSADSLGNVVWAAPAGGGGLWTTINTTDVYLPPPGNVGIGTFVDPQSRLVVAGYTGSDGPTAGTEFLSNSSWTSTGWTGSWSGGWVHTAGNTNTLTYLTNPSTLTNYVLTFTLSGGACINTWSFGGVVDSSSNMCSNNTFLRFVRAETTGTLQITPFSNSGTLVLSVKPYSTKSAALVTLFSTPNGFTNPINMLEMRAIPSPLQQTNGGNMFIGTDSGDYAVQGQNETGIGFAALQNDMSGNSNTAVGSQALNKCTTCFNNLAVGYAALSSLTTGTYNAALGYFAASALKTGVHDFALGTLTMNNNVSGSDDMAVGYEALFNVTGSLNTGVGNFALYNITSGSNNTGLGYNAGYQTPGFAPNQTSTNSVYIGYQTEVQSDGDTNETVIGYQAHGNGSNTSTIGNIFTTGTMLPAGNLGIGTTVPGGTLDIEGSHTVIINHTAGYNGTCGTTVVNTITVVNGIITACTGT